MNTNPAHRRVKITHFAKVGENDGRGNQDDRLLVDDVELLRDGGSGSADTEESGAGLRDQVGRRRQLLDELGGAFRGRWGVRGHGATSFRRKIAELVSGLGALDVSRSYALML